MFIGLPFLAAVMLALGWKFGSKVSLLVGTLAGLLIAVGAPPVREAVLGGLDWVQRSVSDWLAIVDVTSLLTLLGGVG